jgi:predicted NBD/HSP70 family sugar kinase
MNRRDLTGFAVDFGGTKITAASIEAGEICVQVTEPTNRTGNLREQLDHIDGLLRRIGYTKGTKLGLAVTGLVSRTGLWSAINESTLPEIRDAPLRAALQDRYREATCCNDAAATTLAEARFGAGQGCRDFVYLTVSTGVGGGLVLDGNLVTGARGLAGHFGFATTAVEQNPCGSGRNGTIEAVASGLAIARKAETMGHTDLSAKEIFEQASSGAKWADQLIEVSARTIAGLVIDLAVTVSPEKIALGGSIGLAPGYLERIQKYLALEPQVFQVPVTVAHLGHEGPLLGALAHFDLSRA